MALPGLESHPQLTERRRASHTIGADKVSRAQRQRLEHQAPLPQLILPPLDLLQPLLSRRPTRRPHCNLVPSPTQVDEGHSEALLAVLVDAWWWLSEVLRCGAASHKRFGSNGAGSGGGGIVGGGYDEELERDGLRRERRYISSRFGGKGESDIHLAVDLVLLVLALLLDHEDGMIEQEDLQLCALALRSSTFLERSLVDHLAVLVS